MPYVYTFEDKGGKSNAWPITPSSRVPLIDGEREISPFFTSPTCYEVFENYTTIEKQIVYICENEDGVVDFDCENLVAGNYKIKIGDE